MSSNWMQKTWEIHASHSSEQSSLLASEEYTVGYH